MKKKEPISLFNIFAENLSSNELGLKTKNKVTPKEHHTESNSHKEEQEEILKKFAELTEEANIQCSNLKKQISMIENKIKSFNGNDFIIIYDNILDVANEVYTISGKFDYYIESIMKISKKILMKK